LIKDDRLEKFLNQREIKKIIVVPGKIINIVC
jgi:leucyl-tRNA synthetase